MSLKFYITLFFTLLAALVALLFIEDPEGLREFALNPFLLTGFLALVAYSMMESKKRYLTELGALLMVGTMIFCLWLGFKLYSQAIIDYNISILNKWRE